VSRARVGGSGGNPVAVLTREKRASIFARLTLAEERLSMDRTKPLLALALALGGLTLFPAAAAQAATTHQPATFIGATITPTCISGTGEFPCEPGQVYNNRLIQVHESCDTGKIPGHPQGDLSTPSPPNVLDPGHYSGVVNGSEANGANVYLKDDTGNGLYVFHFDLSPNQPSFTGDMLILSQGATGDTGEYSVTGQRSIGPLPGCSNSAPAKKCKKKGKKSEAQSAKKKKCKKK
jgi:hypothetical protein